MVTLTFARYIGLALFLHLSLISTAIAQSTNEALAERAAELARKMEELSPSRAIALKFLKTSPEKYFAEYRRYLYLKRRAVEDYGDTTIRNELANEYIALADMGRYRLRKPNTAILLYDQALRLGMPLAGMAIADTFRFDLHNNARATEHYQRALTEVRRIPSSTNQVDTAFTQWIAKWVTEELNYLNTGKPFSGPLHKSDIKDLGPAVFQTFYLSEARSMKNSLPAIDALTSKVAATTDAGADLRPFQRAFIEQTLKKAPHSNLLLLDTFRLVVLMPSAEGMLRFLAANDPNGYATAFLLATIVYMSEEDAQSAGESSLDVLSTIIPGAAPGKAGRPAPLFEAGNRFAKQSGIALRMQTDPRLSSPESTWGLLLESLKKADVEAAMTCFTADMQEELRPEWSALSAAELHEMAESFGDFSLKADEGGIREATFTRRSKRGNETGSAYFANEGGEWKIQNMQ
jgi:hypothetical protein